MRIPPLLRSRTTPRLPSVPGPPGLPGLGALPRLIAFSRDTISSAGRLFARYGPLAQIARAPARIVSPGGIAVVLANGPELNREILTAHDRYHMYALPGTFYADAEALAKARGQKRFGRPDEARLLPVTRTLTGLFHVNGDEHRRHRRLLMPAFHKSRIDAYRDDMVAIVDDHLRAFRADETRDVLADMTEITLRIATKTLFGEDAGDRGLELARMMQSWLVTMFSPGMFLRLDLGPTPYRRWLDLTREIDARTIDIVRRKRAHIRENAREGAVGRDMLSMLIAARDEDGSTLDEDELVGHTGVIFAAGHETSTNALAWTLMLLALHPAVAEELVAELRSVLRGDAPTVEQLGKLPYLDAVVKESMRVLPPVPLHPRLVAEDHELAGHFMPKNTELFLSIFHMHHDPAIFPRPRSFDPARWTTIKPTAFEYNPFSAGPRMCIGAAFATMEIKIVLATLLQRWRVELLPGDTVNRRVAITMAPRDGLRMRVRATGGRWAAGPRDLRGNVRELVELS